MYLAGLPEPVSPSLAGTGLEGLTFTPDTLGEPSASPTPMT